VSGNLAREARKVLKAVPFTTFGETVSTAYRNMAEKLPWDAERKKALDEEFSAVYSVLADFPLAKTVPFFEQNESKEKAAIHCYSTLLKRSYSPPFAAVGGGSGSPGGAVGLSDDWLASTGCGERTR